MILPPTDVFPSAATQRRGADIVPPRAPAARVGATAAPAFALALSFALALTLALAWTLAPRPARAGESAPVVIQGAEVRLIGGSRSGGTVEAGLEIRLQPHWKTYWRYPGDAGVPPQLSFTGSHNVLGVAMDWPAPRRFTDGSGVVSIGYKGSVLFPLTVTLADPSTPARLHLMVDFAVCEALCLPAQAEFSLVLDGRDVAADARIAQARASVPKPAPFGGTEAPAITAVHMDTTRSPAALVVEARVKNAMADLFVEGPDARWALPLPQKTALPDGRARFIVPLEGLPPHATVDGAKLTFTLVDPPKAVSVVHAVSAR